MFELIRYFLACLILWFGIEYVRDMVSAAFRIQRRILRVLERIEDLLKPVEQKAVTLEFYEVTAGGLKRVSKMKQSIDEVKKYKILARDKAGNEASLDGVPEMNFTDAGLADLVVAEDGSFEVTPKLVGTCKLQVKADALIGEGVEELLGEADFEFTAGKAVSIEVVAL